MDIKKVVVIGSGTMGSGIAAHLCNANVPVTLLDLTTEISEKARDRIHKSRPPLLLDKTKIENIKVGNIKDNFDANVEGIYTEAISGGEISNEFNDEEEKEKFEEPGNIIEERTIVLKISENNQYNYQLELRQKGLVIKPLDNSSVSFIESNKGLVIQSAISEVMSVVGFVKSQIKTIIIDIKEKF